MYAYFTNNTYPFEYLHFYICTNILHSTICQLFERLCVHDFHFIFTPYLNASFKTKKIMFHHNLLTPANMYFLNNACILAYKVCILIFTMDICISVNNMFTTIFIKMNKHKVCQSCMHIINISTMLK